MTDTTISNTTATSGDEGSLGAAIVRITLGVIILVTWWGNLQDSFYSADGLRGFFDWLFKSEADGGNGSSLGFVKSIIDNTVLKAPGLFGFLQTVMEFLIGIGLLLGAFTRLFSALGFAFFVGLLLSYFGGGEWIWTYVILAAASLAVFLDYGGRKLGVDQALLASRGKSPGNLLW